tara:strand:- start:1814 stop:2092 length:279 start_codon:yes stop_codon:yes gene_type:complete
MMPHLGWLMEVVLLVFILPLRILTELIVVGIQVILKCSMVRYLVMKIAQTSCPDLIAYRGIGVISSQSIVEWMDGLAHVRWLWLRERQEERQ